MERELRHCEHKASPSRGNYLSDVLIRAQVNHGKAPLGGIPEPPQWGIHRFPPGGGRVVTPNLATLCQCVVRSRPLFYGTR